MVFRVPEGHEGLFDKVRQQFDSLVRAHILGDVFSPTDLMRWLGNFTTPEEQYLAAKLMQSAVIRSWKMIDSSLRQIVDIVAPHYLRLFDLHQVACLDGFERELRSDDATLPVRFMGVDGERIDVAAGNSGDAVLRRFGTQFQVGEAYRLRADRPGSFQHDQPTLLILLDDLLGTGTQIGRFVARYGLNPTPPNMHLVYAPLLATTEGIAKAKNDHPNLYVSPIEELDASAKFFHPIAGGLWSSDGVNSAADVKSFYRSLMRARGVPRENQYSLELSAVLPERCPNNTLRAYWSRTESWHPLKTR